MISARSTRATGRGALAPLSAFGLLLAGSAVAGVLGCTPKVQVEAPREPITINLNVKIEHEIRVKVDEDLEHLFEKKDGEIF